MAEKWTRVGAPVWVALSNAMDSRPCACPLGIARGALTEWRGAHWTGEQRTVTIETTDEQDFLLYTLTSYVEGTGHVHGVLERILYSTATPCCSSSALAWSLASLLVFGSIKRETTHQVYRASKKDWHSLCKVALNPARTRLGSLPAKESPSTAGPVLSGTPSWWALSLEDIRAVGFDGHFFHFVIYANLTGGLGVRGLAFQLLNDPT
jgi:hypothetical protein